MKRTPTRSIQKLINDELSQWQKNKAKKEEEPAITVITVSREIGSGGTTIAVNLAKELGFTLYHQEIVQEMAESANISKKLVETLDKRGLSWLEETIASIVNERHLWPEEYLRHLMKVVGTIGRHGKAVIVGRGANFILPPDRILRIRVIAPKEKRVRAVAKREKISEAEAEKKVLRADADRRSFMRKYFYVDVADPFNYDVVINTDRTTIEAATESIIAGLNQFNAEVKKR